MGGLLYPPIFQRSIPMSFHHTDIHEFNEILASKAPVPGGGGASALAASLGAALGSMVANLTIGKKKYVGYEAELSELLTELESLRIRAEELIDADAEAFEPLAKAYAIPKDASGRDEELERCLRIAARPPMEMLRLACRGIMIHERLEEIGSVMAISDVGTGVIMFWAAMFGAAMNVRVNTRLMKDRAYADKLNAEVGELMACWKTADAVYEKVWERLK